MKIIQSNSGSKNVGSKATFLYHFQKENDQWELESWECLCSRSGNAEKCYYVTDYSIPLCLDYMKHENVQDRFVYQ